MDDEVVRCDQCDWPIKRSEPYVIMYQMCDHCGELEPVGAIHLRVCAYDKVVGEPRATSQKRRMGATGMN